MKNIDDASLSELLMKATTPEELQAVEELLDARQQRANGQRQSPSNQWIASTLGEVADLFDVTVDTVRHWRTETPQMPGSYGSWPIKEIIKWRESKLKSSDLKAKRLQQDFELAQLKIEQERLDLAERRGELVEIREVDLWAAEFIIACRETLLSIPDTIGTILPIELKEIVRAEAERIVCGALLALMQRMEHKDYVEKVPIDDSKNDDGETVSGVSAGS